MDNQSYTRVSNALVNALVSGNLTGAQMRVILTVIRFTSGFHRQQWKLSTRKLEKITGLSLQGAHKTLKSLLTAGVLVREQSGRGFLYSVADPSAWDRSLLERRNQANKPQDDQQSAKNGAAQLNSPVLQTAPVGVTQLNDHVQPPLNTYKENMKENIKDNSKESTLPPGVERLTDLWTHHYPLEKHGMNTCKQMLVSLMQQGFTGEEIEATIQAAVNESSRSLTPWDLKRRLERGELNGSRKPDSNSNIHDVSRLFKYLNDLPCERPAPETPGRQGG